MLLLPASYSFRNKQQSLSLVACLSAHPSSTFEEEKDEEFREVSTRFARLPPFREYHQPF